MLRVAGFAQERRCGTVNLLFSDGVSWQFGTDLGNAPQSAEWLEFVFALLAIPQFALLKGHNRALPRLETITLCCAFTYTLAV